MCRDPDVSPRDIVQLIQVDPALTLRVIRLANSPFYGVPRTVTLLRDAVMYLGADAIGNYVLSSCLADFRACRKNGYALHAGEPWHHSVAAAVCAQTVAEQSENLLGPAAFACGLLHDLGKVVLDACDEAEHRRVGPVLGKHGNAALDAEREVLGVDHAQAGGALAAHWNLPEDRVNAIRWHHDPMRAPHHRLLVCQVHVGNVLAVALNSGEELETQAHLLQAPALAALGLSVGDVMRLRPRMRDRFDAALGMLHSGGGPET